MKRVLIAAIATFAVAGSAHAQSDIAFTEAQFHKVNVEFCAGYSKDAMKSIIAARLIRARVTIDYDFIKRVVSIEPLPQALSVPDQFVCRVTVERRDGAILTSEFNPLP